MNDENLERQLRKLPAPELPEAWRAKIISTALREAASSRCERAVWPAILIYLRNLCARNPITAGAMAALWLLILCLKVSTPVDVSDQALIAHYDPNRPIYFVSIQDQIRIAELLEEPPERNQLRHIP